MSLRIAVALAQDPQAPPLRVEVLLGNPNGDMAAMTGLGARETWTHRTCAVERHALGL